MVRYSCIISKTYTMCTLIRYSGCVCIHITYTYIYIYIHMYIHMQTNIISVQCSILIEFFGLASCVGISEDWDS